jgi:hypothetical protein
MTILDARLICWQVFQEDDRGEDANRAPLQKGVGEVYVPVPINKFLHQ